MRKPASDKRLEVSQLRVFVMLTINKKENLIKSKKLQDISYL